MAHWAKACSATAGKASFPGSLGAYWAYATWQAWKSWHLLLDARSAIFAGWDSAHKELSQASITTARADRRGGRLRVDDEQQKPPAWKSGGRLTPVGAEPSARRIRLARPLLQIRARNRTGDQADALRSRTRA